MRAALRVERVLATGRAFLAVSALAAIIIDPSEPTRYARVAYGLFALYTVHSLLLVAWLRADRTLTSRNLRLIHSADILWPVLITLFTEGPSSSFFLFFVFVVVAAAYRWGFRETWLTAAATVVLLGLETALVAFGVMAPDEGLEGTIVLNRVVMRATYLMLLGFLLGYLTEEEKRLRLEHDLVARATARAGGHLGFWETLRSALTEIMRGFGAERCVLCFEEVPSGRRFVWEASLLSRDGDAGLTSFELGEEEESSYWFASAATYWRRLGNDSFGERCVAVDEEGNRVNESEVEVPRAIEERYPHRALMCVGIRFREEWRGALYLLDPTADLPVESGLRLLQTLVTQVSPTVHSVYLASRLRAQAGALERSRVARELHDGAVQSLIAVELEIEVLRRRIPDASAAAELSRLRGLVQDEVMNIRALMQNLRPVEVDSRQLLSVLSDTVEKFRRETGIEARFLTQSGGVSLSPRVCRELVQILREALVNVRKHSGARHVLVRFGTQNGGYTLVVDDDGRGFPFAGRWTQHQLEAERRGPAVIRERLRDIGAEMIIESTPGHGSRLEIHGSRIDG